MSEHARFHLKDLDQLDQEIARLGLSMKIDEDVSVLSEKVKIGSCTAPNRFAVHPMEGFDADYNGSPGNLAFRRYTRYAAGGFGLIWMEATAVMHEGRSNPHQFYLHAGSADTYARLVADIKKAGREKYGWEPVVVLQLTHSGRYSKPEGIPVPIIAHHSPVLDPRHSLSDDYPLVTDEYLDNLKETYVDAARLAAKAGFDGIDIKSCHRYLVSELHASFTRENSKYGGSFENRTRLLRESLEAIKKEVPGIFISTRMNAYDAIDYPYGFGVDEESYHVPNLTEPIKLAGMLKDLGVPILNISIGNPYFNPHFGRPFDFPSSGVMVPEEHPLAGLDRFMKITREFQETYPDLAVLASGYSWLRQYIPYVGAATIKTGGATILGLGRGAFAYPDTPSDVINNGKMDPSKCCVTCSACTQIMRDGAMTGCVVRDSEVYGPQYRLGRRFAIDRLKEEARRCRECESATCTRGCPAHVNVPAFIKAFADDDIETAYKILKDSNLLPEMCAYVCPSEVQCEGNCLEEIFCEHPVPIRDIQLVVCRIARAKGLVGVEMPEKWSGKSVCVVGGGPAGIAATIKLIEAGHRVVIYERSSKLGGTPDSIIPSERYPESETEIDAVLKPARETGVFEAACGKSLGSDIQLEDLQKNFDAVLIAVGLTQASSLGEGEGVEDALAFLAKAKRGDIKAVPEKVAVIGGGNTAMDAAVTAIELGARDSYLVYRRSFSEMPAWPAERDNFMESGGHLMLLTQPVGYETDPSGKLTGLRIARTELGEPDDSGRRRPAIVPDSESILDVGMVIEALGQGMSDEVKEALDGVELTDWGLVKTAGNGSYATSLAGVFAAGDIVNGGTTAVQGVTEGMHAAAEIGEFLSK